jgi:hypothetical protein
MSTKDGEASQARGQSIGIPWIRIIAAAVLLDLSVFTLLIVQWTLFGWDSGFVPHLGVVGLSFLISWQVVRKAPSQFLLNAALIGLIANVFRIAVGAFFIDVKTAVVAALPLSTVILLGCVAAGRLASRRQSIGLH